MTNSLDFFFFCLKGTFKTLSQSKSPVLHCQRALPRTQFLGFSVLNDINKKKKPDQMALSLKKTQTQLPPAMLGYGHKLSTRGYSGPGKNSYR